MKTDSSRRRTLLPFQRQNAQLIQMTQNGFINNLLKMKRIRSICFVRKTKMTAKQKFLFLGEMKAEGVPEPVKVPSGADPSKMENAFEIQYVLDTPVRNDIYDYLCGE